MNRIALFFLTFLLFSFLINFPANADATPSAMMMGSQSATISTNYSLAYPGMLPDSPLYFIKSLRDKLVGMLITDPEKKIDFLLLQADKGMLSSKSLLDKNETSLAIATVLKAENNMTLIATELLKMTSKPADSTFETLINASLKHQEILTKMITKASRSDKKSFEQVLIFSKENMATIMKLEKKKSESWK